MQTFHTDLSFQPYSIADKPECLRIFDANCPRYFAPGERADYLVFLNGEPGGYELCLFAGEVAGAFGVFPQSPGSYSLNWILIDPAFQGRGIGVGIMQRACERARSGGATMLAIAASHLSAPFFEKFGAVAVGRTEHGWGQNMHRVDMELPL
jgi:GNAT superfamily N-acetyltransferase